MSEVMPHEFNAGKICTSSASSSSPNNNNNNI
jgi:hypothetical protein